MTRFGIDALVAIRIAEAGDPIPGEHRLVAPSLLRSDVLRILFAQVRSGERTERDALGVLDAVAGVPMRVLGDRVSRRTAWRIAAELGMQQPALAEYLAVTRLQADALVALDTELVRLADGVVPVATVRDLLP